ncbi:MAG: Gfo/Idh/MocA family oxidoreductase [Magnetococcales bacterium]|nr:Gfo/Idh/MocA family oxidoreductase [Magnetococcales bacterium]MBF0151060.1 Gfo/Idh/MocA family oxidoreductase [Magnetococcales bacterium]MBF0174741.1 Gfo/Idh/MocA family oxidoreductase [Magnetococcales bacterium]MBF0347269.1 Gfo/Idh/MocA family oxidoreductase [Magnetococcales bacterium]MBF0631588.1 Gfo/Idh/MocA family oxidoreductase [Magnetococcales bacterium]
MTCAMTVRFAIMGISSIAHSYVKLIRQIPCAEVAAAWGSDDERTRAFVHTHGIPRGGTDLTAILSDPGIDALLIVTEPARHLFLAHQGLTAGKHMLIEKPLDDRLEAARAFEKAAAGSHLIIGVISPYRFNPVLRRIKAILESLPPGTPISAQLSIMWSRSQEYYHHGSGWRARSGPVLVNQGIHWLDVMNWFFGRAERIQGTARTTRSFLSCPDFCNTLISYPGNVSVLISAGTFCDRRHDDQLVIHHPGGRLDYAAMAGLNASHGFMERIKRRLSRQTPAVPAASELLHHQLVDFVSAIKEHRSPEVTLSHGIQALELALAASNPG